MGMKGEFNPGTSTPTRSVGIKLESMAGRNGNRGPLAKVVADESWAAKVPPPDDSIFVAIPVRTVNPTNGRQSWPVVARRAKAEHLAVFVALEKHKAMKLVLARGCRVELVRLSYGRIDRFNLGATLKGVIDGVAMWLLGGTPGQYDEDPRIEWAEPRQAKCPRGAGGVTVSIQRRAAC